MDFYTFFPKILNMSLTASVAIVFVMLLRLLLKKAPKVISYALWGVVLFRLLCPVSFESGMSLFGLFETPTVGATDRTSMVEYIPSNIVHTEYPEVVLPVPGIGDTITEALPKGEEQLRADPLEGPIFIATYVWCGGILVMAIYGIVTWLQLRRRLVTASPLRENIYLADDIDSPFVMGLIRPKIYLPSEMEQREQSYIILHEQHHIRRMDHIVKALAFAALCIHWFNPLVWVAFILSGKDMEMSCDEAVVRKLGTEIRADYTASLLSLATGKRIIAGMPLAFGEGNTKGRIKNLANWKRPAFWVVLVAIIACIVLAVGLLTNPRKVSTPYPITSTIQVDDVQWAQITLWGDETDHIKLDDDQTQELIYILNNINERDFVHSKVPEHDLSLMIYCGEVEILLHWDGDYTEFSFDSDTAKDIDKDYRYIKNQELNAFLSKFCPHTIVKWFDYTDTPSAMEDELTIELPEFPGVTFTYNRAQIIASKPFDNSELTGHVIMIGGMPIWNAYFTDLTGDGYPDICATYSYGSGIIDTRIVIHDYANGASYELSDRGYHDFYLRLNEDVGGLYVEKRVYPNGELVSSGRLVYKDGCILLDPSLDVGVSSLREKYPEYIGLDTSNGLDVYVWQMNQNSYSFGVLPHEDTPRDWISAELMNLRGTDAQEMRLILKSYGLEESDIHIIPWQNPYSSYIADIWIIGDDVSQEDKQMQYIEQIRNMLFPSEEVAAPVETTPTESPVPMETFCDIPLDPGKTFVDLTQGDVRIKAEDIGKYVFYTNSTKIVVNIIEGNTDSGIINLHPVESWETFIGTHELQGDDQCVFRNLTSAAYYAISIENLSGCELTVSEDQSFLDKIFE